MVNLDNHYVQCYNLIENIQEYTDNGFATDLLQYGITIVYYEGVVKAISIITNIGLWEHLLRKQR